MDLTTEWYEHFKASLWQTQCVIDAYRDELETVDRIVFMPHGTQWETPFAALKHPRTGESLYQTHELLLSPSLRYCVITDNKPKFKSSNNLVIGDPTGTLPGARQEAESVAKELGCVPLLGSAVTRACFLRSLSESKYNVIHYAGHGSYTADGLHALILSDGIVTDDDILSCKVSANVVNLASCWSGMTDFSVWNELGGFIRALLISGANNVLGSVYPLGDEAGRLFNTAFYRHYLDESSRPCKAFQMAIASIPTHILVKSWGGLFITGKR